MRAETERERELRWRQTKKLKWVRGREREWGGTRTATKTDVETCGGTQDEYGDGSGDGNESSSGI